MTLKNNTDQKSNQTEQDIKQKHQTRQFFEDSFVAGSLAEEGAQDIARAYLASTPPMAGKVYGDIVYWGTVAATIFTILGSVLSFVAKNDILSPSYVLSSIWQQQSVEQIWMGSIGHLPHGHWYLDHLTTGNGITEFGLAFGVFIVIPAMIGSGLVLIRERSHLFASLALTAAVITTISMLGLLPLPIG